MLAQQGGSSRPKVSFAEAKALQIAHVEMNLVAQPFGTVESCSHCSVIDYRVTMHEKRGRLMQRCAHRSTAVTTPFVALSKTSSIALIRTLSFEAISSSSKSSSSLIKAIFARTNARIQSCGDQGCNIPLQTKNEHLKDHIAPGSTHSGTSAPWPRLSMALLDLRSASTQRSDATTAA